MSDIALPTAPEAEVSVLGAVFADPAALAEVRGWLAAGDFHRPAHRVIYLAMQAAIDSGSGMDVISLAERMKAAGTWDEAGGYDYVATLLDAVPSASAIRHHAGIVRDKARLRRMIEACEATIRDAMEGADAKSVMQSAERRLLGLDGQQDGTGFRSVGDAVMDAMELIERAAQAEGGIVGIHTGVPALDRMTAGLEAGGLTILAARPAMGKSAIAWQVGERAAMDGHNVLIASYEMSGGQLGRRGLSRLAHIDADRIRRGQLDKSEWAALAKAGERLAALPIWIDEYPPHEIEPLRSQIHRHKTRHAVDLVVVDYLQQMSGPKGSGNRNNEIEHISRGLKRMARELGVHVLALAQLSRGVEHRNPPRPVLSDLRDSGAIEQDADNVLLLWRPEYYFGEDTPDEARAKFQGRAELIVAKQRDGETGNIWMTWEATRLRFTELGRVEGMASRP